MWSRIRGELSATISLWRRSAGNLVDFVSSLIPRGMSLLVVGCYALGCITLWFVPIHETHHDWSKTLYALFVGFPAGLLLGALYAYQMMSDWHDRERQKWHKEYGIDECGLPMDYFNRNRAKDENEDSEP